MINLEKKLDLGVRLTPESHSFKVQSFDKATLYNYIYDYLCDRYNNKSIGFSPVKLCSFMLKCWEDKTSLGFWQFGSGKGERLGPGFCIHFWVYCHEVNKKTMWEVKTDITGYYSEPIGLNPCSNGMHSDFMSTK